MHREMGLLKTVAYCISKGSVCGVITEKGLQYIAGGFIGERASLESEPY